MSSRNCIVQTGGNQPVLAGGILTVFSLANITEWELGSAHMLEAWTRLTYGQEDFKCG